MFKASINFRFFEHPYSYIKWQYFKINLKARPTPIAIDNYIIGKTFKIITYCWYSIAIENTFFEVCVYRKFNLDWLIQNIYNII